MLTTFAEQLLNALASRGAARRRALARAKLGLGIWATYLAGGLACALLRKPLGFGAMALPLTLLAVASALHVGTVLDPTKAGGQSS